MFKQDLTGKKFNRWTVLEYDNDRSGSGKSYWICKCDCGTIKSVRSDRLKDNSSKSCGCLNRELAAERMKQLSKDLHVLKQDLTGKTFGYWYVESRAENQNNHVAWNCICKCGTKRIVLGQSLKNGTSMSCGCLHMSHGELAILNLLSAANINFIKEYVIQDLYYKTKNNKCRFDFFVNHSYAIEFDGIQHYSDKIDQVYFTHGIEDIKILDELKNQYCKDHNIPLIRIPYTHLKDLCLEDLLLETTKWRVAQPLS